MVATDHLASCKGQNLSQERGMKEAQCAPKTEKVGATSSSPVSQFM